MINPLTVAVYISLDRAIRRWRAFGRGGAEQYGLSINRDAESAEDDSLVIPMTPIPRRDKCSLPYSALLYPSIFLSMNICGRIFHICERPTVGDVKWHGVYRQCKPSDARSEKGFLVLGISGTPLRVRKAPGLATLGGGSYRNLWETRCRRHCACLQQLKSAARLRFAQRPRSAGPPVRTARAFASSRE
jgi:hypothetical protein